MKLKIYDCTRVGSVNRCFVCEELLLHMVSVSRCHAFAKRRSGLAGSYFKARNRLGCLAPQNVHFGQAQNAEFGVFQQIKGKPLLVTYPSILCALISVLKKKKKTKQNDKENLSLTGAYHMTRQPIEKQTNSITHCLVYKAPSTQFDSLCSPQ